MEGGRGALKVRKKFFELLRPWALYRRMWEVPIGGLAQAGVRGVILDYDNTLALWRGKLLPQAREWMDQARKAGIKLCVLSNASGGERVKRGLEGVEVGVEARALKPLPFGLWRAARRMGLKPEEVVVVGDQIFTDVLGGNLAGMRAILVRPISRRELVTTRLMRLLERSALRILRPKGYEMPWAPQGGRANVASHRKDEGGRAIWPPR